MHYSITVTEDFIKQRELRLPLYNKKKKPEDMTEKEITAALMRIDCEIFEWYMVQEEEWTDEPDDWKIDGYMYSAPHGREIAVDVKTIGKYWNIEPAKLTNILLQRNTVDGWYFVEWIERPDRPLEVGDEVIVGTIGFIDTDTVLDNIRPSKWNGHYLDARKLV